MCNSRLVIEAAMKNISKFILSVNAILFVSILPLFANNEDEFLSPMREINAHGECAVYVGFTYEDYSFAGFRNENEAIRAKEKHFLKAQLIAQDLFNFLIKNKVEGKYLISTKGNQTCIMDQCFEKKEYIEAMYSMGAGDNAMEEVTKKDISCPVGAWHPCKGGEPVGNRGFKAGKLYKDKNCRVLLR